MRQLLLLTSLWAAVAVAGAPVAAPKSAPAAATPAVTAVAGAAIPAVGGVVRDCPACPALVVVPAGTFVLGTSSDARELDRDRGESPPLSVRLSRPFAIGQYEVTVGEFRAFVAATQYAPAGDCRIASGGAWVRLPDRSWQDPGFGVPQADNEPVVCVSWDDAKAYVDWLSKQSGKPYRLPSETEWEYAARGGTASARFFGDSGEDDVLSVACDYANVYDASAVTELAFVHPNARCSDAHTYTTAVGSFKSNAFDLYDVIGNAREWLQDCYTASYEGRPTDGRAWEWAGGCELRGVRGGSWATRPAESRSAARGAELQGLRQSDLGFRVARDL